MAIRHPGVGRRTLLAALGLGGVVAALGLRFFASPSAPPIHLSPMVDGKGTRVLFRPPPSWHRDPDATGVLAAYNDLGWSDTAADLLRRCGLPVASIDASASLVEAPPDYSQRSDRSGFSRGPNDYLMSWTHSRRAGDTAVSLSFHIIIHGYEGYPPDQVIRKAQARYAAVREALFRSLRVSNGRQVFGPRSP